MGVRVDKYNTATYGVRVMKIILLRMGVRVDQTNTATYRYQR